MESFRLIWQFFAPLKRTTTIDFTIEMEPLKAPIRHLNRLLRWIEREWNFSYVFNLQHNKKDSGLMVIIFSYIFVKLKVVTSKIHHQSAEKKNQPQPTWLRRHRPLLIVDKREFPIKC